jgi:hypothetical protein
VPTRRMVDYQNRKVEGEVVDFHQDSPEAWNAYTFSDGTVLKLKTVLLEAVRLIGEYGPTGEPIYIFSAQQIAAVNAPDNLKQPSQ